MNRPSRASASSRSVRNLAQLRSSGSTARTLNLIDIYMKHGDVDEYRANPFFRSQILNRSIVVKHRLRSNERELFPDGRSGATKVILPIDILDLRSGARSFFVGQEGYQDVLLDLFGAAPSAHQRDVNLLNLLDRLPSLDPFLMRERLKKSGFTPARFYFDITEADTAKMFQFLRREIAPLIGMSFDDVDAERHDRTAKFAMKIMANDQDADMEPFRLGLGMDRLSFDEGMFCWKGFIYYKWTLNDLLPLVRPVTTEIGAARPNGPVNEDEKHFISGSRLRLTKAVALACETVRLTLKVYDDAYADLTRNGQPQAFREFLLRAPTLFYELGERLAAVQHIVSFWRYRFPSQVRSSISADELVDLLADFEFSLSFERQEAAA